MPLSRPEVDPVPAMPLDSADRLQRYRWVCGANIPSESHENGDRDHREDESDIDDGTVGGELVPPVVAAGSPQPTPLFAGETPYHDVVADLARWIRPDIFQDCEAPITSCTQTADVRLCDLTAPLHNLVPCGPDPLRISWFHSSITDHVDFDVEGDVDAIRLSSMGYPFRDVVPFMLDFTEGRLPTLRRREFAGCARLHLLDLPHAVYIGETIDFCVRAFAILDCSISVADIRQSLVNALALHRGRLKMLNVSASYLRGLKVEIPGEVTRLALADVADTLGTKLATFFFSKYDTKEYLPLLQASQTFDRLLDLEYSSTLSVDVGLNISPSPISTREPLSVFWTNEYFARLREDFDLPMSTLFPCFCTKEMFDCDYTLSQANRRDGWVSRVRWYAGFSHLFRKAGEVPFTQHCLPGLVFENTLTSSRHLFAAKDVALFQELSRRYKQETSRVLEWLRCAGGPPSRPGRIEWTLSSCAKNVVEFIKLRGADLLDAGRRFATRSYSGCRRPFFAFSSQDLTRCLCYQVEEVSSIVMRLAKILSASDGHEQRYRDMAFTASVLEDLLRFFFDGQRKNLRSLAFMSQNGVLDVAADHGCMSLDPSCWQAVSGSKDPISVKISMIFKARGRTTTRRTGALYNLAMFIRDFSVRTQGLSGDPSPFDVLRVLSHSYRDVCESFLVEVSARNDLGQMNESTFLERGWACHDTSWSVPAVVERFFTAPLLRVDRRQKLDSPTLPIYLQELHALDENTMVKEQFRVASNLHCLRALQKTLAEVLDRLGIDSLPLIQPASLRPRRGDQRRYVRLSTQTAGIAHPSLPADSTSPVGDAEPERDPSWLVTLLARDGDGACGPLPGPSSETSHSNETEVTILEQCAGNAGFSGREASAFIGFIQGLWHHHFDSRLKNHIDVSRLLSSEVFSVSDDWIRRRRHTADEWLQAVKSPDECRVIALIHHPPTVDLYV